MKYSIALSLVPRVGSKNMRRLLAAFGSAEAVMNAGAERLTEAGASPRVVQEIASGRSIPRAMSIIDICERTGVRVLTLGMPGDRPGSGQRPDCVHERQERQRDIGLQSEDSGERIKQRSGNH